MILERFELKKSTKVALCAPGRPFKVTKGVFSPRGLDSFTSHLEDSLPLCLVVGSEVKMPSPHAEKCSLGDFELTSRSAQCDFCGFLELKPL